MLKTWNICGPLCSRRRTQSAVSAVCPAHASGLGSRIDTSLVSPSGKSVIGPTGTRSSGGAPKSGAGSYHTTGRPTIAPTTGVRPPASGERRDHGEVGKDVQPVKPRESEERRAEERAAGADPLAQKPRVLAALTGEEYRAEDDRGREPAATLRPRRKGHRAAACEKRDGEDGRSADIQRRLRRGEPRVAVRDVSQHDREEEDRLRGDEDGDAEERAVCPDGGSHRDHGASRSSGCLRSQRGRRPLTAGMLEKFSGGGGEVVAHSRVNASHGSSPAISPERRLRTRRS